MKRLVLVCAILAVSSMAVAADQVIGYRPGNPGLFFEVTRDATSLSTGLGQLVWHGWAGIGDNVAMADLNGDGMDDKVMWQPAGTQWQFIVSYTGANGDLSNTSFDVLQAEWWNNTVQVPVFGDINGDGVDDNGMTSSGADIFAGGGIDDALVWGHWLSTGTGLSGSTDPHSGWSLFGVHSLDEGMMGDFNGDGIADRAIWRESTHQLMVDYGNAAGGYGDSVIDTIGGYGIAGDEIVIGDLNGDGKDDVLLVRANTTNDYYELYGYTTNNDGTLGSNLDYQALAGMPSLGDKILLADIGFAVPEPATLAILGLGGLVLVRRKK